MATARTKPPPSPPRPEPAPARDPLPLRMVDAAFRFLASLKLAIILLMTLASVLAVGTFYERNNGTQAVQVDIYQSKWFALLLALLGINILCAALIRFPWKRRQTGFVITHAGLIILLIGAYLSINMANEGRVSLVEGESTSEYVRIEKPLLLLEKLDPATGEPTQRTRFGFQPGASAWETDKLAREAERPGHVAQRSMERGALFALGVALIVGGFAIGRWTRRWQRFVEALAQGVLVTGGLFLAGTAWAMRTEPRRMVLSEPGDGFRLVMTDYLPSATGLVPIHEPAERGVPMIRAALLMKPPGQKEFEDGLRGDGWIVPTAALGRGTLNLGPATLFFHDFRGERGRRALADFLTPPQDPTRPTARFHYLDKNGEPRSYDWVIREEDSSRLEDGKPVKTGRSETLPESDLTATLVGTVDLPTNDRRLLRSLEPSVIRLLAEMGEATGSAFVQAVVFKIRRGDGPEVSHFGWADLPLAPNIVPLSGGEEPDEPLVAIDFFGSPELQTSGDSMRGRLGQIEVALADDNRLFYRAFGRGVVRGPEQLRAGETVKLFGGDQMPMQLALRIDELLPSGRVRMVCKPLELPPNLLADRAIPAARFELTVNNHTRDFWLPRSAGMKPEYHFIDMPDGPWQASFDFNRGKLDCQISLLDFDPQNDPGSTARMEFRSDVAVLEPDAKLPPLSTFAQLQSGDHFHFVSRPRESFVKTAADRYEPFDGGAAEVAADPGAEVQPTPQPIKIYMNHPLERNNWKFFQASFEAQTDRNRQPTGSYISVFAVRYDPTWPIVYGGCLVIVLGIFVQFYMRAGVFTDHGRREREKAEARARRDGSKAADLDEPRPGEPREEL